MIRASLRETGAQKSDTQSDLTDDYVESIETTEEPLKKPPIPRPRTSKVKESVLKSCDTNTESMEMDKISSMSEQYDTSNFTMKSEPKSYKDSIKSRFLQIKSNSSKSLLKAKKKGVELQLQDSISFALLREESKLVENKLRNKKKYDIESSVTTISEKIAFFCEVRHILENSEEIQTKRQHSVVIFKAEDLSALVENAKSGNIEVLNGFTSSTPAENDRFSKRKQDGIYKPKLPSSRKFDLNLLEKRLIESDIKDWFGSDGHLKFLDNPSRFLKIKPVISKKDFAQTVYSLPTQDSSVAEEIVVVGKTTIIDINFKSIRFSHHPLFSTEHVLQEMLLNFYDIYREFVVSNKQERISKRLETLRTKVKISEDGSGDMKPSLTNETVKQDISLLREKLFQESKKYRDNMKNILATWKNIKKVRDKNEFSNTAIKLLIRKEAASLEADGTTWNEQLEIVSQEILEEDEDLPEGKTTDFEVIKELVTKRFKESFRWPGEPILNFNLAYENEISNIIEKQEEKMRRAAVQSTKINLKISCNSIDVCSTKFTNLNDNFTLPIEEPISIRPDILPDVLLIELFEQNESLPTSKLIGSFELNITSFNGSSGKIYERTFASQNIVHYKHDGVGSGGDNIMNKIIKKYELHEVQKKLELSGTLNFTLKIENSSESAKNYDEILEQTDQRVVDPENPFTTASQEYEKSDLEAAEETGNKKKLQTLDSPHFLCSPDDLQNNLRFKLLQLRERNEPEFTGMIIPNRLKEIPSNVLVSYNRRITQEQNQIDEEQDIEGSHGYKIVARRSLGRKQLRQVYTKIFQQCKNRENCLQYEDVVDEKNVPQIQLLLKTVILNFFNWFKLQPKLSKPIPKIATNKKNQLKVVNDLTSNSTIPKIKIRLLSGNNFPSRRSDSTRESSDEKSTHSKNSTNTKLPTIKPFVEFSVNNLTIESNVAEGANPIWNEELVIPLESSSTDYLGPNSLSGSMILNIFDSCEDTTTSSSKRLVRWLGFLQLPISAISSATEMEGIFPVKQTVLFDYEYPIRPNLARSPGNTLPFQKIRNTMYIQMSLSMEPHVPKLSPDFDNTPCNEPPFLKNHLTHWNNEFNNSHSERKFCVFALDTEGRSSCVTRYIRSLEPPQINRDGFDVTATQCAKYIAMIPFTETNKFYENIWLNTEQLLKYQIGSITDHAIALACYLLALNLEVWLLLGGGLPHGHTVAYVLEREYSGGSEIPKHYVYDVTTGIRYNILDTMCPLQKVYCVINELNVWANIQRESNILLTRFDFSRRFDWLSVFNNQVSAPTNSVQIRLVYTHMYDVELLEATIEAKLRKKITKGRKLVRTVWSRPACLEVKNALKRFEISHLYGRKQSGYGQNSEFKTMCRQYGLKGFLLNIPFDRMSTLIDIIQSTRIFDENNTNELVMAVSIQPYPNNILNLWLAFCYSTL